jgi:hypothetical protein
MNVEVDFDDSTPAIWQREFTVENLMDYARASKELSQYVRVLDGEGFKNLVVPSRGAMPFESPRVLRRLQPLRRWSHEEVKQVLT